MEPSLFYDICPPCPKPPREPCDESETNFLYDVPKNTSQCVGLIIVDGAMQPYGEVKQFLIKKSSIINAYGGEIFGLGVEETTKLRGDWNWNTTATLLSFRSGEGALKCYQTLHINETFNQHMEYFNVPLCNPMRNVNDNGLLEISFYNVHYFKRFNWYVCQLPEIASKHHGHLIAGTKKLCHKLGMTQPNYITLTQWRTLEEFKAYRDEAACVFESSESACATQALIRLDTFPCDCV